MIILQALKFSISLSLKNLFDQKYYLIFQLKFCMCDKIKVLLKFSPSFHPLLPALFRFIYVALRKKKEKRKSLAKRKRRKVKWDVFSLKFSIHTHNRLNKTFLSLFSLFWSSIFFFRLLITPAHEAYKNTFSKKEFPLKAKQL
jgi:hypothetical protein